VDLRENSHDSPRLETSLWYALCNSWNPVVTPRGEAPFKKKTHPGVFKVETITQMPVLIAAAQYSLIYLLLGGGFGGAVVVYIVAKLLGK
jgi:hypothetical protein